MMQYAFALGPVIYTGPGKDGAELTLVRAIREVYGVGQARVLRLAADGTWVTVVRSAGSIDNVEHVPSGRIVRRGPRRAGPSSWALRSMLAHSMRDAHALGRHVTRDGWWDQACPDCKARAAVLDACVAA